MSNIVNRTEMSPERAAKREAIRARLAAEKAYEDEFAALLRAEREQKAEEASRRRVEEMFRLHCAREVRRTIICHHDNWHDNCPQCKIDSERERAAEATANR